MAKCFGTVPKSRFLVVVVVEVDPLLRVEPVATAAVAMECAWTAPVALSLVGVERPPPIAPPQQLLLLRERAATATVAMECARTAPVALSLVGAEHPPRIVLPQLQLQLRQAPVEMVASVTVAVPIRSCVAPNMDGVERPPPIALGEIFVPRRVATTRLLVSSMRMSITSKNSMSSNLSFDDCLSREDV